MPQGRGKKAHKEQFLNPIFQNKLHVQCLQVTEQTKQKHVTAIKEKKINSPEEPVAEADSGQSFTSCETDTRQNGRDIKEEVKKVHDKTSECICPQCGSKLVLRTAKRGNNKGQNFYGCSNFPQCRYIQNS